MYAQNAFYNAAGLSQRYTFDNGSAGSGVRKIAGRLKVIRQRRGAARVVLGGSECSSSGVRAACAKRVRQEI